MGRGDDPLERLRRPDAVGHARPAPGEVAAALPSGGARTVAVEADLTDVERPGGGVRRRRGGLGPVTALVMCHCESVDSGLLDTTVESFDRHYAVNVRASWLLVREYGERRARCTAPAGSSR